MRGLGITSLGSGRGKMGYEGVYRQDQEVAASYSGWQRWDVQPMHRPSAEGRTTIPDHITYSKHISQTSDKKEAPESSVGWSRFHGFSTHTILTNRVLTTVPAPSRIFGHVFSDNRTTIEIEGSRHRQNLDASILEVDAHLEKCKHRSL